MVSVVNALYVFSVQIHDVLCAAMMAEAALPNIAMMTLLARVSRGRLV